MVWLSSWPLVLALCLTCGCQPKAGIRWLDVPEGTQSLGSRTGRAHERSRSATFPAFRMAATETTVGQFLVYLNDTGAESASRQVARVDGIWQATVPRNEPMVRVSQAEARQFADWLSRGLGQRVRLPTGDEWEYAARAGADGAPFPWGWESAAGRACFAAEGPQPVAGFAPNRWGFYDMAGNVAEWCSEPGLACGGSWSDRTESSLQVHRRLKLPESYADADTGFRLLCEIPD